MEIFTRPSTAKGPAATFSRRQLSGTARLHPLTSITDLSGGFTHEHRF